MIIFDLDCLADDSHRRHFIDPKYNEKIIHGIPPYQRNSNFIILRDYNKDTGEIFKPDYKSYYEACNKDKPIKPVVYLWNQDEVSLALERSSYVIWTSRCESIRNKTIHWLDDNIYTARIEDYEHLLKMRPAHNTESQEKLFESWLNDCTEEIEFVFSRHKPTIDMFRRRGIFVFDCNQE